MTALIGILQFFPPVEFDRKDKGKWLLRTIHRNVF